MIAHIVQIDITEGDMVLFKKDIISILPNLLQKWHRKMKAIIGIGV